MEGTSVEHLQLGRGRAQYFIDLAFTDDLRAPRGLRRLGFDRRSAGRRAELAVLRRRALLHRAVGAGIDTATFDLTRADYTVTENNGAIEHGITYIP